MGSSQGAASPPPCGKCDKTLVDLFCKGSRSISFLDHANRKIMVKHSLPQVHPEASTGVFARHLLKNDGCSVFQTRPNPNRNESDGEHDSWRLIFVADGLNWWKKHHCQKDEGGSNQFNSWSKPQLSSKLYIGYHGIPCTHILCTFLFLSLGGEFLQGGLLWQRILCFYG